MHIATKWRLMLSIGLPALAGLGGAFLGLGYFLIFGWVIFIGLPFLITFVSSYLYRRTGPASWGGSYGVSLLSLLATLLLVLLFAIDGLVCLLMSLPLAVVLGLPAAWLGHNTAEHISTKSAALPPLLLVAAFPLLVAFESTRPAAPVLHEVTTSLPVKAPIARVWDEVIAFDRIETPPSALFRLGVAYPIEARIEGTGVGAIRRCVFSTGAFVEPITRWDAPHILEFDVTSNPPPLRELSPWGQIEVPHLHNTFVSERGRFRLVERDGFTILEGTTWYRQAIVPDWYWHRICNYIIHQIHLRVLEHIKSRAENDPGLIHVPAQNILNAEQPGIISESDAGKIALDDRRKAGWKEARVDSVQLQSDQWVVRLTRLPEVFGGHATVKLSTEGEVIEVIGGR